jgi:hypothetical protein
VSLLRFSFFHFNEEETGNGLGFGKRIGISKRRISK